MFSVVGCLGEHLPRDPCRSCRHLQLPLIAQPPTKLHAFTSRSTGASICNQTCSILSCLPTAVRLHPSHPTVPFRARLGLLRVFLRSNSATLVLPNPAIECCNTEFWFIRENTQRKSNAWTPTESGNVTRPASLRRSTETIGCDPPPQRMACQHSC